MIPCAQCSTENTDDSFYCKKCGTLLEGASDAAPDDLITLLDAPLGEVPRGTVVEGGYRVEELLGSGGMGIVYRAESVETEAPVAVKFLRASRRWYRAPALSARDRDREASGSPALGPAAG